METFRRHVTQRSDWIAVDNVYNGSILPRYYGENLNLRCQKGMAIRYFFPDAGEVVSIENVEQFRDKPWIHKLGFFVGPGDIVDPVTDHTKRADFVITTGKNRGEAVERSNNFVKTIKIVTTSS